MRGSRGWSTTTATASTSHADRRRPSALDGVALSLLDAHVRHCVTRGSSKTLDAHADEIVATLAGERRGLSPSEASVPERLSRLERQVARVQTMVEDDRYCIDILEEINAAKADLEAVSLDLVAGHVRTCLAATTPTIATSRHASLWPRSAGWSGRPEVHLEPTRSGRSAAAARLAARIHLARHARRLAGSFVDDQVASCSRRRLDLRKTCPCLTKNRSGSARTASYASRVTLIISTQPADPHSHTMSNPPPPLPSRDPRCPRSRAGRRLRSARFAPSSSPMRDRYPLRDRTSRGNRDALLASRSPVALGGELAVP